MLGGERRTRPSQSTSVLSAGGLGGLRRHDGPSIWTWVARGRFNAPVSTVDPVKRERDPAVAARRRAVLMAVLLVLSAAAGYGGSIFGDFPGGSYSIGFNQLGPLTKALLAAGGLAAAMVVLGFVVRLPKPAGIRGQQSFVLAVAMLAYSLGILVGGFLPTSIGRYGHADLSGPRGGVRVAGVVLAVLAAGFFAWAARQDRARRRRAQLRATGRRTMAVVTEVHDTGITNNNAPWVRLTVRFTDAHGTQRFVRRRSSVNRFAGPSEGDRMALWFDPQDPGNEKKIVLGER